MTIQVFNLGYPEECSDERCEIRKVVTVGCLHVAWYRLRFHPTRLLWTLTTMLHYLVFLIGVSVILLSHSESQSLRSYHDHTPHVHDRTPHLHDRSPHSHLRSL